MKIKTIVFICLLLFIGAIFLLCEDTEIILNPSSPVPEKGQRKRLVFTEELTIGEVEGEENYMFGDSVSVEVDDSGCFYVLDWDNKHIQKYDNMGKYLLTIGRKGQGPGEFRNIWGVQFDQDGNVYATDIVNKRISFFSCETGEYQKQIRLTEDLGAVILLPNGNYFSNLNVPEEKKGGRKVTFKFGILNEKFQMLTELHRDYWESPPRRGGSRAELLAGLMSGSAYKPSLTSHVTGDDRILIGYSDKYEIKLYDLDGNLVKKIQKKCKPRKVSSKHKEFHFNHRVIDFLRSFPGDIEIKDEVRKKMKYPKYLPAYLKFVPMDNGWLFVIVDVLEGRSEIDLFDEQGTYIGRFETDIPTLMLSFKNGKAYSVTTLDDYKFVKRYHYSIESY